TAKEKRATYEAELKEREAKLAKLTGKMMAIENEAIKKMPAEEQNAAEGPDRPQVIRKVPRYLDGAKRAEYESLKTFAAALKKKPYPSQALALSVNHCLILPPQAFVMLRGNPHSPGAKVEPGFPKVLGFPDPKLPEPGPAAKSSGRRTLLANWIASQENPLT